MPWMKGYPYYLLLSGTISLYMGIFACRFRRLPGRRYAWVLLLLIASALVLTAAEIMASSFKIKLLMRNLQQLPLLFIPLFAYAAVRDYVSPLPSRFRRKLTLLSIPLVLDIAFIFTDPYHHLIRSSVGLVNTGGIIGIMVQPTLLSMALIAYDQVFGLYAAYLFAVSLRNVPEHKLKLNVLLLLGMLISVISSIALPALKITFTGFTVLTLLPSVAVVYFAVNRYPQLSPVPSVSDRLLGSAIEGMVLTDRNGVILSINETGEKLLTRMFGPVPFHWLGLSILSFLRQYPSILGCYENRQGGRIELEPAEEESLYCSISLIPLEGSPEEGAMLLMISDCSDQKRYERELEYQASIDDLTGLYNRRHFLNTFNSREHREGEGMAMLLMDIDDFKQINDAYGHLAGDQALVSFSRKVLNFCKNGAIAGRLGGEEFVLCLFARNEAEAVDKAEAIRRAVVGYTVMLEGGHSIHLTVSIGMIYTEDPDTPFEQLYRQADEALYLSKTNGKNKVTVGGHFSVS
ncbi:histidine kinase N-terminal 7TM domain-containing diguanylate cyclase [Paenibacillus durus]|uniref:histidine kinase N-terminal 7TM domain-containing diguanylate cyclase n=1 Tax=Paenibacillus durus TaxID=44251 RepID=UPI00046EF4B1|nr:diguanylate cyclase [Paenibacillus durus]